MPTKVLECSTLAASRTPKLDNPVRRLGSYTRNFNVHGGTLSGSPISARSIFEHLSSIIMRKTSSNISTSDGEETANAITCFLEHEHNTMSKDTDLAKQRKIDLDRIRRSLHTVCTKCGHHIQPADVQMNGIRAAEAPEVWRGLRTRS